MAYFEEGVNGAKVSAEVAVERLEKARVDGLLDCAKGGIPKAQQVRAVFSALSRQSKQSGLGKRAGEAPATPVTGIAPTTFPRDDSRNIKCTFHLKASRAHAHP